MFAQSDSNSASKLKQLVELERRSALARMHKALVLPVSQSDRTIIHRSKPEAGRQTDGRAGGQMQTV